MPQSRSGFPRRHRRQPDRRVSHRRLGRLARALVEEVERRLVERGGLRISALVEGQNPLGVGFWDSVQAFGYEREPGVLRYVKTLTR